MFGIKYLGKHSYYDMGVTMAPGRDISIPRKKKILVTVPFSNEEYDFSEMYGEQTYEPRTLFYPFNIKAPSKEAMNAKKTKIINWLLNSHGKQRLYDDAYPGYYFLAELEGDAAFNENWHDGVLTVTFRAYPFMIAEHAEGDDIWDTFNFELDVAQVTEFNVSGNVEIILYNVGSNSVTPEITTSSSMKITMNNIIYNINAGTTNSDDFQIPPGENKLNISGNGTISFKFHKELI